MAPEDRPRGTPCTPYSRIRSSMFQRSCQRPCLLCATSSGMSRPAVIVGMLCLAGLVGTYGAAQTI